MNSIDKVEMCRLIGHSDAPLQYGEDDYLSDAFTSDQASAGALTS